MTEQDQASVESTEAETETTSENAFGLPDDHPAMKHIKQLRTENGSVRTKNSKINEELKEKAKKWEEYEMSQKTEVERLAEEKSRLEEQLKSLESENVRKTIMTEFKLDADLEEYLTGDADQMRAKAKKLAEKLKSESAPDLFAGNRGKPVVKDDKNPGADFIAGWARLK